MQNLSVVCLVPSEERRSLTCQASNFVNCWRLAYSEPRPRSRVPPTKQRVSSYPRLACSAGPSLGIPKHSFAVTRHHVACICNGKAHHVTPEYMSGIAKLVGWMLNKIGILLLLLPKDLLPLSPQLFTLSSSVQSSRELKVHA